MIHFESANWIMQSGNASHKRNHHPISIISQPLKRKHPKAKMSSLPYKQNALKNKLPPPYYTHLVLSAISAFRLLVVFFKKHISSQPLWRPGGKARPVLHDIQKHPALLELSAFSTCSNGCCTFKRYWEGKYVLKVSLLISWKLSNTSSNLGVHYTRNLTKHCHMFIPSWGGAMLNGICWDFPTSPPPPSEII